MDYAGSSSSTYSFKMSQTFLAHELDQGIKLLSRFPEDHGECSQIALAAEMTLN